MRRTLMLPIGIVLLLVAGVAGVASIASGPDPGRARVQAISAPAGIVTCAAIGCPYTTTTTTLPATPAPAPPPASDVAPAPDPAPIAPAPTQDVSGGFPSDGWWRAIAVCESGNDPPTDSWRTGFFGLESGQPEGGRGWDAELAEARSIFANYGAGAWGCTATVGAPY